MKYFYFASRERNFTEILELLWSSTSIQRRMILQDSLLTRQAGIISSLQSLCRDIVLVLAATEKPRETGQTSGGEVGAPAKPHSAGCELSTRHLL